MSVPIRRTFTPPPAELRPWVERFWSWESDCAVPLPLLLPGTGADLFLHYRTPFLAITPDGTCLRPAAAHLTCLRSHHCRLVAQGPIGFVAVRFRTSAIRHFGKLGLPDLLDRFPDATEHFGPEAAELPGRLAALPDLSERAALLARFLLHQLGRKASTITLADRATEALYYGEPDLSIAELADELGYSCRQLERAVGEATGLTPKRFHRLTRFHHTVRHLLLARETDYLDAALARGYYDQAHFIHEFRALAGQTPTQLLKPETFMSHFYNPRLPR
ncbi:MAG: transcriptional activator FtrA [Verrucomicrobia bacterium ADurb.Bin122]|nr:MAG: transcriptional activator FtrA [Verrucomicrobia bacterium ADurb.Bin122]